MQPYSYNTPGYQAPGSFHNLLSITSSCISPGNPCDGNPPGLATTIKPASNLRKRRYLMLMEFKDSEVGRFCFQLQSVCKKRFNQDILVHEQVGRWQARTRTSQLQLVVAEGRILGRKERFWRLVRGCRENRRNAVVRTKRENRVVSGPLCDISWILVRTVFRGRRLCAKPRAGCPSADAASSTKKILSLSTIISPSSRTYTPSVLRACHC